MSLRHRVSIHKLRGRLKTVTFRARNFRARRNLEPTLNPTEPKPPETFNTGPKPIDIPSANTQNKDK